MTRKTTTAKRKRPHPIHAELRDAGACPEARRWARGKTPATIWQTCERGDRMLWWAGRCAGPPGDESRRTLTLAACACARTALPIWESRYLSDKRPRAAIETAEAWARGDDGTKLDAVRAAAAAKAAFAAATAADAKAAYAAYAAAAAAATAYATAPEAYAAEAAAADAAAYDSALRECADIVRRHYPKMPRMPK